MNDDFEEFKEYYSPVRQAGLGDQYRHTPDEAARVAGGRTLKALKVSASFVEPMLLLSSKTLPEGPEWLYELKLDGYRTLAIKSGGRIELRSRNDNDFTGRYPKLAKALEPLPNETVLDGEVVALDASGRPSFNSLQNPALAVHPCTSTSSMSWCLPVGT